MLLQQGLVQRCSATLQACFRICDTATPTSIMGVSGGRPAALAMAGTSSQYHSAFEGLFSGTKELGFSLSLTTPSKCTCECQLQEVRQSQCCFAF